MPNNTAPDGKLNQAIDGLKALNHKMLEHSGIDSPLSNMLHRWFGVGQWAMVVASILTTLLVIAAVFMLCGCCCIPLIRSLCERSIQAAVDRKYPPPPFSAQFPMLEAQLVLTPDSDIFPGALAEEDTEV